MKKWVKKFDEKFGLFPDSLHEEIIKFIRKEKEKSYNEGKAIIKKDLEKRIKEIKKEVTELEEDGNTVDQKELKDELEFMEKALIVFY